LTLKHRRTLQQLGVHTVYLFGSLATGRTHGQSDVDVGVLFDDPRTYANNTMPAYLQLYDIFTDVFPTAKQVDIVFLQLVPPSLQFNAIRDGKILYVTKRKLQLDFEADVMKTNADMQYYYKQFHKTLLERI
jgi:predicted nucleotidyltransferase